MILRTSPVSVLAVILGAAGAFCGCTPAGDPFPPPPDLVKGNNYSCSCLCTIPPPPPPPVGGGRVVTYNVCLPAAGNPARTMEDFENHCRDVVCPASQIWFRRLSCAATCEVSATDVTGDPTVNGVTLVTTMDKCEDACPDILCDV